MEVVTKLSEVQGNTPSLLTIGTYDGIHNGHQAIIHKIVKTAKVHDARSVLVTLHPHPRAVLVPDRSPGLLTTPAEKIEVLRQLGLDTVAILPFTREFALTPAREFIQTLVEVFRPIQIWEGADFAWGRNREGDIKLLRTLGREYGFEVRTIELQQVAGEIVSSTRIRQYLIDGDVRQAAILLNRYPSLQGKVVVGSRRGRSIGFPTANIAVDPDRLLPAMGVYAVYVWLKDERYAGVANIGIRPSFGESTPTVEAFIFDFDRDIYGQRVKIDLVEYLRPEMKFEGIEALVTQIGQDAAKARKALSAMSTPG
jgi:riboflavin kinase / FMN adenylyltransferase